MTIDAMKNIDLNTVDPNELVDLRDVLVDGNLSRTDQIRSFLEQIKNPYCYRVGKTVVKVSFIETETTIEDRLEHYIRGL